MIITEIHPQDAFYSDRFRYIGKEIIQLKYFRLWDDGWMVLKGDFGGLSYGNGSLFFRKVKTDNMDALRVLEKMKGG